MDLNDLIPCTESPAFVAQATAFARSLDLLPKKMLPSRKQPQPSAAFVVWLVGYMDTNPTDEIGNFPDLVEYAILNGRRR